jgi:hypothetical protein
MPQLTRVLTEADLTTGARLSHIDLAPYLALLSTVLEQGVGGIVTLGAGEQQRTEKRRLSVAAQQQGYTLTWRKGADPGQLRFVLAREGQPAPGGRKRRTRTEQQLAAIAGEGAMNEALAGSPPPTANRRRRTAG